jgi:hypothetical protein
MPLTWENMAARLGVSVQAVYKRLGWLGIRPRGNA